MTIKEIVKIVNNILNDNFKYNIYSKETSEDFILPAFKVEIISYFLKYNTKHNRKIITDLIITYYPEDEGTYIESLEVLEKLTTLFNKPIIGFYKNDCEADIVGDNVINASISLERVEAIEEENKDIELIENIEMN